MIGFALAAILHAASTPSLDFTTVPDGIGPMYKLTLEVEAASKASRKVPFEVSKDVEAFSVRDLVEFAFKNKGREVKEEGLKLVIVGHKGSPTRRVVVTSDGVAAAGIAPAVVWDIRPKK